MSRYTVQYNQHWISFGWDCPMNTFFAQVESDETSSDELLLDIGSPFDCLYTQVDSFHDAPCTKSKNAWHSRLLAVYGAEAPAAS